MNKKGFTLVELMAVILLLTILIVLVITNASAPLDSSNSIINNSKINVLLAAAKNYAEDNINQYAMCTYSTSITDVRPCIINIRDLIDGNYIDEDDIKDLSSEYSIIACFNPDNTTISTYYKNRENINCNDLESHRLHLDPQITSVYFLDTIMITSSITTTGAFQSLECEVSPDNITRANWATCSISSDNKMLNVQFYAQNEFPYSSSQSLTIRVVGNYLDDNNTLQEITKNFRLMIYR